MTSTVDRPLQQVRPTRPSAPVRPVAPSRWRSRVVRLAESATTPLLPSDFLDLFAPLRPGAALRGRIVSVTPETADAATIVLKPGADWAGHVPGQYVRIGIDVDGVRHWRAYSLTHGPRRDGFLSITVKAVPAGKVSNHLVHRATVGTMLHLEQAAGEFVLPERAGAGAAEAPSKLLFVTAGSGITPVIGMLRNLFPATDSGVLRLPGSSGYDIVVVHVAPTEPDSIFLDNLRSLDRSGAIRLVARYDDQHGLLDVADLASLVPDLDERTTFACGPTGLMDAIAVHHEAAGLTLYTEQFRTGTVVAGEGGPATFTGRHGAGLVVDNDGATPILTNAEDAGLLMPSGCRMGICYGCVLPMRSGAVRDLRTGAVTVAVPGETDPDGVLIQTCINAVAGACEIDH